jgi:hypothetical protein
VWRPPAWVGDVVALADEPPPAPEFRALLEVVMRAGERTTAGRRDLTAAHTYFEQQWTNLPTAYKHLSAPETAIVQPSTALIELSRRLDTAPRPSRPADP